MNYIIKRTTDGAYVADMRKSVTGSSYTLLLQRARTFNTREEAEGDRCGNEVITTVEEEMGQRQWGGVL